VTSATQMLRPYVRKQWRTLGGAGLAAIVLAVADLAKPWPLKLVIDEIIVGHQGAFELGRTELFVLAAIAGLVLGIALVQAFADNVSKLFMQRAAERISHEMRVSIYDHLQRLSLGFHQRRQKGDLVNRVTGDANVVGEMFAGSLANLVQAGVLLVGMLVVAVILDPLLALVWLATVPFFAVVAFSFRARIRAAARRQRAEEGAIASAATEALSAMAVVKAFGSERFERERVEERSEKRMQIGIEASRLQAQFNSLIGVLSAVGTAAVIVLGVFRVAAGAITPGDLIVFASYARKVDSPLRHLAREAAQIAKSMARAERIAEILSADEVLKERAGAYEGGRAAGEIVFDKVSFAYDPTRPVFAELSLRVEAGSRVAVVGASGAGKSSLGALIARLYDPAEGRVLIDGRDVRDCSHAWLRRQVGVLLQDTVLFTGSVAENIAYGSEADHTAIVAVAGMAAADGFVSRLPEGYETKLGPQGAGLSGGQRQRIGIARTLLRDPPILLLDEPTTALDVEAEARLLEGLERLMRGRTTILITHSLELARTADRVVVLEAGRIVAEGPPEEILSDGVPDRGAPRHGPDQRPALPPADPALPQLHLLLDTEAMAAVLARSLGAASVEEVRLARVLYKPRRKVAVHFRALVDGHPHDAVARAAPNGKLAAELPRYLETIGATCGLNGRSPASIPVAYDEELDALVTWLPFDAALPALVEPPARLADRLLEAGVRVPPGGDEPRLLGYKPGARAVIRLGDHVLKAYGSEKRHQRAVHGLVAASALRSVRTARYEACLRELRLTVQSAVDGVVPEAALDAAGEAGGLARRLHETKLGRLSERTPEAILAAAARRAELVSAVVPELADRVDALVAWLAETIPDPGALVLSHGDLHVDQLLRVGTDLALVDFDELCLAPPALDLGTYIADVARGRSGDLAAIDAVRDPLLEGYGGRPAALEWHVAAVMLTRAAHPFEHFVPGWGRRVGGMVGAAEAVLAEAAGR
jgi:ATP-binding cassette subfamily B protein